MENQRTIQSTHHSINASFNQRTIQSTHHSINAPFNQRTIQSTFAIFQVLSLTWILLLEKVRAQNDDY
jgi:hypothetical protein